MRAFPQTPQIVYTIHTMFTYMGDMGDSRRSVHAHFYKLSNFMNLEFTSKFCILNSRTIGWQVYTAIDMANIVHSFLTRNTDIATNVKFHHRESWKRNEVKYKE